MSTPSAKAATPSPETAGYIADMLAELADMAAAQGDPALEAVIRIAAIQAERSRSRMATGLMAGD